MRGQKITLGEMRASGPRRLLVYCGDYKCAHSRVIDAAPWPDHIRLSDLEPKFTCEACGHRGADVRPLFEVTREHKSSRDSFGFDRVGFAKLGN
jgi:hypothetical protein